MNKQDELEKFKLMYEWLQNGYRLIEKRLAEVLEENTHLRTVLQSDKNVHPFID